MSFISKNCSYCLTYSNSAQFLKYQAMSGLGFNKLGFYEDCVKDPMNQFYLDKG